MGIKGISWPIDNEGTQHHEIWVNSLILFQFDTLNQSTITLCDFASAGENGMPYISWLPVIDKVWQFGRLDGTVIAKSIRLLADGRILGHNNDNEFRWGLEGDTLVFFHRDNRPSTRFNLVGTVNEKFKDADPPFPFNGLLLQGQFLFDPNITHLLIEIGPSWGSPEHDINKVPPEQQIQRYKEFRHRLF